LALAAQAGHRAPRPGLTEPVIAPTARRRGQASQGLRYTNVIKIDPEHFNWLAGRAGAPGGRGKYFGAFTKSGFWIEYIKGAPPTERSGFS